MKRLLRTGLHLPGSGWLIGAWVLAMAGCETPSSPPVELVAARGGGKVSVTVMAADPDTVPVDTVVAVRILGTGFVPGDPTATVAYLLDNTVSTEVTATQVKVLSTTELVTTTAVTRNAPLGRYSIEVTFAGGKRGIGAEKIEVVTKPILLPELNGTTSDAVDLNDLGVIVGTLDDGTHHHAVRWIPQGEGWAAEDLGLGSATVVTNAGEMLVHRPAAPILPGGLAPGRAHVRLADGTEVDLGEGAVGAGMSEAGTVVGFVSDGTPDGGTRVLWPRTGPASWGAPVPLPSMVGYEMTRISGISDNGQWVFGYVHNATGSMYGVVWTMVGHAAGTPSLLDTSPSLPSAVSSTGAIAGVVWSCGSAAACRSRPAFWPAAGAPRQLVPIAGGDNPDVGAHVYDMNDRHQMVGWGPVPIPTNGRKSFFMTLQPALWNRGDPDVVDLSSYRRPRAGFAEAIDATGRLVVGRIEDQNGRTHAIAWVLP